MERIDKPIWFSDDDVQDVVDLLRKFVKRLNNQSLTERSKPLRIILKSSDVPGLFEYSNPDKRDFIIEVLFELSRHPYNVWNVSERGESFLLVLNGCAENLLRVWLDMPLISALEKDWSSLIGKSLAEFNPLVHSQLRECCYPGGASPLRLIESLKNLSFYLDALARENNTEMFSWRQLSARFFWGDSKYFDSDYRRSWLLSVFPSLKGLIRERLISVTVALSISPKKVLFVENWDSFCLLSSIYLFQLHYHLVYTAGFKVGSKSIRKCGVVSFLYTGCFANKSSFEEFWFSEGQIMPTFFWGDLDFSGLQILESLMAQFVGMSAWIPGYQPMLEALVNGVGHEPSETSKEKQVQIEKVSCKYANDNLLVALNSSGLMLDQEWLSEGALLKSLINYECSE